MPENPTLKIYKASAGSGKTYTLAWEFLSLLFSNPYNYKSILAVTFTNKATAEMKSRILEYLFSLTIDDNPEFLDKLCEHTGKSSNEIRKTAKLILTNILNDFSHFSISTIDSFVQKVIRSFAFEAGLPTNLYTELNYKTVLSEAVDTLLREINLEGNEELKKWMLNQAFIKLQEGKDWKTSRDLNELGEELFKEQLQGISSEMAEKTGSIEFMNEYVKTLQNLKKTFESETTILAQAIQSKLKEYNITKDDLAGKSRSPLINIFKLIDCKDFKATTVQTLIKNLFKINSVDDVINKTIKADRKQIVEECYFNGLEEAIERLKRYLLEKSTEYYTSLEVLSRIRSLAVLTNISEKITRISHDKNIFLLANANILLKNIIDENDTPFIYEKTGTRYNNFMIDEFQDTSNLQWNNFKPLISNGLSEGKSSLIVGDVKQSIYRWRNSEWKLLDSKVELEFPGYSKIKRLEYNYRSLEKVILFNNFIFKSASKLLQKHFNDTIEEDSQEQSMETTIINAYSDTEQKIPSHKKNSGGYTEMTFIETSKDKEFEDAALPLLIDKINKLKNSGYEYRDICILVREKKEGRKVSEYLMSGENPLPVISDESLFLESSPAVDMVINQLKFIQNPSNEVLKAYIKLYNKILSDSNNYINSKSISFDILSGNEFRKEDKLPEHIESLKGKPLFELMESLIRQLPEWLQYNQAPYLKELLNKVQDFITTKSVNVSDFLEWWEDKGKTTSITTPEGQNAVKIMTIHKSKGLEFKAVIVPFCHWDLDTTKNNTLLWCKPDTAPFNLLEIVPVRYGSGLTRTIFAKDFYRERLLQFIDNLNILYVAFTRAREALITISKVGSEKLNTVGELLYRTVTNTEGNEVLPETVSDSVWNEETKTFTLGNPQKQHINKTEFTDALIKPFKTIPFNERIKIHTDSDALNPDILQPYRVHGKLMHLLFEKIMTKDDIEPAINSLIIEGKLPAATGSELKEKITHLLSSPPYKDWFSNKFEIRNETSILKNDGISRPDRVMINKKDKSVIVVDYKFGKLKNIKYIKQVLSYMKLLNEMGYTNIKGYLWYINNEISLEEIKLS
ncbi:MAG: UvrD-helicase domain-containing protein [Chlorobi bacterium]|nr:UvrD-helicase domain-containing protein [Chlorobiota bacterium]